MVYKVRHTFLGAQALPRGFQKERRIGACAPKCLGHRDCFPHLAAADPTGQTPVSSSQHLQGWLPGACRAPGCKETVCSVVGSENAHRPSRAVVGIAAVRRRGF